jgi:hypothetical protein
VAEKMKKTIYKCAPDKKKNPLLINMSLDFKLNPYRVGLLHCPN